MDAIDEELKQARNAIYEAVLSLLPDLGGLHRGAKGPEAARLVENEIRTKILEEDHHEVNYIKS